MNNIEHFSTFINIDKAIKNDQLQNFKVMTGKLKKILRLIKAWQKFFVSSFLDQDLKEMFCYLSCFDVSVRTQEGNFHNVPFQTHHHR